MSDSMFDADAIYARAQEQHARMEKERKENSKWGKVINSLPEGVTGFRMMPLPGSIGGYFEPFVQHRLKSGNSGDTRTTVCQEYFGRNCLECIKAEQQKAKQQKRVFMLGFFRNKDKEWDFKEPKFLAGAGMIAEGVTSLLGMKDDDGDLVHKPSSFLTDKLDGECFLIQRTGSGLKTNYEVRVRTKGPIPVPAEAMEKALEYAKNWKKYFEELYLLNLDQETADSGTTSSGGGAKKQTPVKKGDAAEAELDAAMGDTDADDFGEDFDDLDDDF